MLIEICNFKITFTIIKLSKEKVEKISNLIKKNKNLIFNYKHMKCTFYLNKHFFEKVNVTGIKTKADIFTIISILKKKDINVKSFQIDNTTVKLLFKKHINLFETANNLKNKFKKYSYNKDKFSGIFYYKNEKNSGTAILFANGKIIILGCNSFVNIKKKCQDIIEIVSFV